MNSPPNTNTSGTSSTLTRLGEATPDDLDRSTRLGHAALDAIEFWSGTLAVDLDKNVHDPREIERRAQSLHREEWADWGVVTTDSDDVRALIGRHADAGFDEVELLTSTPDIEQFVEVMDESVLPVEDAG